LRVELAPNDLARLGLVATADPMWELASSLRLLGARSGVAFTWWRRWVRYRLPEATRVLEWLYVRGGAVPGFLLPPAGRTALEAGLAEVRETGSERLRADLHRIAPVPGLPAWASALPSGDRGGLPRLVQAIRDYFEAAVAPHWETMRAQVEADREARAETLAKGGADALLASLAPVLRWEPPVLRAESSVLGAGRSARRAESSALRGSVRELRLEGAGFFLAPSYFSVRPEIVSASAGAVRLAYPTLPQPALTRSRRPPRTKPTKALSALLGPTRAAALAITVSGCSTSDLAARLGVSPSAVSKHTSVLRAAGLITTRRDRNTVRHSLTPLGCALLES
jgi:Helix-turn-helix domain